MVPLITVMNIRLHPYGSGVGSILITLDNADEQAAQIRRELDGRLQVADQMAKEKRFPRFLTKEMEGMFIEELRASVNLLMANLESLPVSKGGPEFKLQKLKRSTNSGFLDIGDESEVQLSKSDVVLSFTLEESAAAEEVLLEEDQRGGERSGAGSQLVNDGDPKDCREHSGVCSCVETFWGDPSGVRHRGKLQQSRSLCTFPAFPPI
ncbi:unnamed protein product [Ranitomeya imitator]|uniref:Uncharacterized protein n=1 Tax=Ranitomeya imitator TaxID=111125 RepID=A0ABN9LSU2_9NEOB|nr:unnamed protein product [Ranitomeya imitator]